MIKQTRLTKCTQETTLYLHAPCTDVHPIRAVPIWCALNSGCRPVDIPRRSMPFHHEAKEEEEEEEEEEQKGEEEEEGGR